MNIAIRQTLSFNWGELKGYFSSKKALKEVRVEVKGVYSPPQFIGEFEGYSKASLDIEWVKLEGKIIDPTKRLLLFLQERFLIILVASNIEENNDC